MQIYSVQAPLGRGGQSKGVYYDSQRTCVLSADHAFLEQRHERNCPFAPAADKKAAAASWHHCIWKGCSYKAESKSSVEVRDSSLFFECRSYLIFVTMQVAWMQAYNSPEVGHGRTSVFCMASIIWFYASDLLCSQRHMGVCPFAPKEVKAQALAMFHCKYTGCDYQYAEKATINVI